MLKFLKKWMLPIAITLGAFLFLVLWFVRPLAENVEPGFSVFAKQIQPILIAIMLFLQFNRVSPHDLRFRKWHFVLLGFQIGIFALLTLLAVMLPEGNGRILVESAMLCFICPTASAAGVVTSKLGGSLSDTVSYVVMINISVALVVPLAIPIVNTASDVPFMTSFFAICMKIFPLLVLPLIIAWIVRYTMRRLQRWLMRYTEWAFYCWGVALCFAIYLATRALVLSGLSVWIVLLIGVISLVCTLAQFGVGRAAGRICASSGQVDSPRAGVLSRGSGVVASSRGSEPDVSLRDSGAVAAYRGSGAEVSLRDSGAVASSRGSEPDVSLRDSRVVAPSRNSGSDTELSAEVDTITAGQALGQKNTGFLIWLGYSYMTPVTSVAGGLYSVFQNCINSFELYQKEKRVAEKIS